MGERGVNTMNYSEEILRLQAQIRTLEKEQAAFDALSEEKQLAIILHDLMCTWNHTDGCGWCYEFSGGVHNFSGQAHKDWLEKAKELIKICAWNHVEVEAAVDILKLGKGF